MMTDKVYKREYITEQFRKSFGNGKKYENYCVSRIYHLLGRSDIQIVTQQVLYRENGKRAMADIYFPQVNMWIEVDEGYHLSQKDEDERRTQEIISNKIKRFERVVSITALDRPERIEIHNKSLEQINERIDAIVVEIKNRIKEQEEKGKFIPWTGIKESPAYFIEKGIVRISDDAQFRTSQQVSDLFNKHYKKGSQKNWFSTNIPDIWVWCPKLSLNEGDFKHLEHENTISPDGKFIFEFAKDNNEQFYKEALETPLVQRAVFPYYKGPDGKMAYIFNGIYRLDIEKTEKSKIRTWVRVEDELDLKQFF